MRTTVDQGCFRSCIIGVFGASGLRSYPRIELRSIDRPRAAPLAAGRLKSTTPGANLTEADLIFLSMFCCDSFLDSDGRNPRADTATIEATLKFDVTSASRHEIGL